MKLNRDVKRGGMWDWGHNCRVIGVSVKTAIAELDAMGKYSSRQYQEFWAGYETRPTRDYAVSIEWAYIQPLMAA